MSISTLCNILIIILIIEILILTSSDKTFDLIMLCVKVCMLTLGSTIIWIFTLGSIGTTVTWRYKNKCYCLEFNKIL